MRKVLNKVTMVMMTLVVTFLLVACGNGGNNNIQGTWISEGMPITSEMIAGDGDTGADVVVELFVNEEKNLI